MALLDHTDAYFLDPCNRGFYGPVKRSERSKMASGSLPARIFGSMGEPAVFNEFRIKALDLLVEELRTCGFHSAAKAVIDYAEGSISFESLREAATELNQLREKGFGWGNLTIHDLRVFFGKENYHDSNGVFGLAPDGYCRKDRSVDGAIFNDHYI